MLGKIISAEQAVSDIHDRNIIMVAGFGSSGYACDMLRALYETTSVVDLTFYLNSSFSKMHTYLELLLKERCKHAKCSFMRNSPALQQLYQDGKVEILSQGTLAESIHLAGIGIPAFYSPVGIGTFLEEGRETRDFDGKEYILMNTLAGDVALIRASKVDRMGNCFLKGSTKNFGLSMAMACKRVYVETPVLVETGQIGPEEITIPGMLIDGVVEVKNADGN